VRGADIEEVRDVHRAIGALGNVRGSRPRIVHVEQLASERGFHGRTELDDTPPRHVVAKEVGADEGAAKRRWKAVAGIHGAAEHDMAAIYAIVLHVREEAVGVRVVQRAVLAKVLLIVATLDGVPE
jgi:hypothetical protein